MKRKNPTALNAFGMRDGRPRETFASGAVREQRSGKGRFDLVSVFALFRMARIYEKGSIKYADRNWEKGMPFHLFIDSAIRHLMQYIMGDREEDHLGQAAWNITALMHLEITHPEFNDLPKYEFDLEQFPEFKTIFQVPASGMRAWHANGVKSKVKKLNLLSSSSTKKTLSGSFKNKTK